MSVHISELRGISDAVLNTLKAKGFGDSESLLEAAKTPQGRKELAKAAAVDATVILELVNRADLARVKGIGRVYSDLMEEAGVDTVKELAQRVPANLHAKLVEINAKRQLTQRPPSVDQVAEFVAQAKELPAMVEY
jgi:predicted flap endonuclease-1-like 5' DNA nuclease